MKMTREELLYIANLASLNLEENEIDNYLENLQDILNFADIVNNAKTDGLDVTVGANEGKNVFRKDEVEGSYDREKVLQNPPTKAAGCITVPKVVE